MFHLESWHSGEYNVNAALLNLFKNYLGFLKNCVVFTKIYVRGVDHDHHPLQEEKLVAGAGAEGCVEGLATFFADLPCRQLKKPHSPAGDAALQQNNKGGQFS